MFEGCLTGAILEKNIFTKTAFYGPQYEHWCMKSAIVKNKKYCQMWFYDVSLENIKSYPLLRNFKLQNKA